VDTNILVYAVDETEGGKREIAGEVVEEHLVDGDGFISAQVLREFYSASRRTAKPLPGEVAARMVARFSRFRVAPEDTETVVRAVDRVGDGFSFWDALIVEAALRGGADRLLSEDMQDGRVVEGMRIENPFA
jgi:predicted nucleic acid-binding protein